MGSHYSRVNNTCLLILATIGVTVVLIYTRAIMVPFVISLFVYFVAAPVVQWLSGRLGLKRLPAVLLTVLLFVAVLGVLLFFVAVSLTSFFEGADVYNAKLQQFIAGTVSWLESNGLVIERSNVLKHLGELPVFSVARHFTGQAFSLVSNFSLILIFFLFLIAGEQEAEQQSQLVLDIQQQVSQYIVVKFFVSILTALLVFAVLALFGIDLAFMFAVLVFFLNFIPSIGSIIGTVLPLPVVALQVGFGWEFLVILLLMGSVQVYIGNFLEPKMLGESMDLHPVAVLLMLMFWGLVWGVAGMFLAVPITAIVKIILSRIEGTRPAAELLAGRLSLKSK